MNDLLDRVRRELDGLPDAEQVRIARVLESELRHAKPAPPGRRWAAAGERLATVDLLSGESEDFRRAVRAWRGTPGLRNTAIAGDSANASAA